MGNTGFFPRALGYIIDAIIVGIVLFIVDLILRVIHLGALAQIVNLLGGFGYMWYFWTTTGQTIGGRVMNFKVVSEATGQPITLVTAIIRYVMLIVSFVVIFLGVLWVLWDPKRQGWHDKVAGTIVVPANTVATM